MSDEPDEIVHQSTRLRILAALDAEPPPGRLDFPRLKRLTRATDGNLGAHLATLERADYVAIDRESEGKRQRSWVRLTPAGRAAFLRHVAYLKALIGG